MNAAIAALFVCGDPVQSRIEQYVTKSECQRFPAIAGRWRRLIALAGLLLSGCVSTGGYIKGQVVDADSRDPLLEAYVAIRWDGVQPPIPADFRTICMHADLTRTNSEGQFSFMPWVKWRKDKGQIPVFSYIDNR